MRLKLRKLESTRQAHEQELSVLHTERQDYLRSLDQRKEVCLRHRFWRLTGSAGNPGLKLVLNQDSPALLSRTLAYYDYFSRSQASQINELKTGIANA